MRNIFIRLSQSFRAVGAGCVTLFAFFPALATANPALIGGVPAPIAWQDTTLTLISPVGSASLRSSPATPEDVLAILRQGFQLEYEDNNRTDAERKWYVRHEDYLQRVLTRSQRYMPYILAELERRGLPLELALLPIVESAYDPFAYSHGRAAGLWQMIPGTARRFGVKQNWWYDGRRDIVDSTRAALDYLEYLEDINDGNWLNAIASYNSGEGNVLRAVRNNRKANKPIDFWYLKLPRETSMYVPKLLALAEIVADPAKYGVTLPKVPNEAQFVVNDIGSQLDLALAAELAGVNVDTIYGYNPGYNRWSTDPAGPHRLVMPVDVAGDFMAALDEVPERERVRWQRHKIKNGEAISQIARHYGTTVSALRAANNLRGNTIRAGQYLMIPVAAKPLSAYSQSADARLARTQNRERPGDKIEHVVQRGESFWTISRRYGVTHRALAKWNGMAPGDPLSVGKKLVVWTTQTDAIDAPATSPVQSAQTQRKLRYTVRKGDSLYLIARRFRVGIDQIASWNGIDKNKVLRPGQRLTMYVDVTAQSS
jgi:membrane-bound lytic murein transglycosylase D